MVAKHSANLCLTTAKQAFTASLAQKLASGCMASGEWWRTIKKASGHGNSTSLPALRNTDGTEHDTNHGKAGCIAEHFANKLKCSLGAEELSAAFPHIRPRSTARTDRNRHCPVSRDHSGANPLPAQPHQGHCSRWDTCSDPESLLRRIGATTFKAIYLLSSLRHPATTVEGCKRCSSPQAQIKIVAIQLSTSISTEHHLQGHGDYYNYYSQHGIQQLHGDESCPVRTPIWLPSRPPADCSPPQVGAHAANKGASGVLTGCHIPVYCTRLTCTASRVTCIGGSKTTSAAAHS